MSQGSSTLNPANKSGFSGKRGGASQGDSALLKAECETDEAELPSPAPIPLRESAHPFDICLACIPKILCLPTY